MRVLAVVALAALATSSALFAQETARGAEIEPNLGLFSWPDAPDPYYLALRGALLGQHVYRKCQLVAIPSFEREWAIFVVRSDDSAPLLIAKRMRQQLWTEMMRVLSDEGRKTIYSIGANEQEAALRKVAMDVDTWTQTLSARDADLLEEVWWRMLGRARYSDDPSRGDDGVTYHVSHWATGVGFRSGETWSPDEGTRPAGLVRLAEHMRGFAETGDERSLALVRAEAQDLLDKLK